MWCNFQKDITCSVSVYFCEHFLLKILQNNNLTANICLHYFFLEKWITTRRILLLRTEKNFEAVRHITFVGQYVTAQISRKISKIESSSSQLWRLSNVLFYPELHSLTKKQRNSVWDTKQFYMYIMHPNVLHLFSVVETWHSKKLRY